MSGRGLVPGDFYQARTVPPTRSDSARFKSRVPDLEPELLPADSAEGPVATFRSTKRLECLAVRPEKLVGIELGPDRGEFPAGCGFKVRYAAGHPR